MPGAWTAPFRATLVVAMLCVVATLAAAAAVRSPPWLGLDLAPDAASHRIKVIRVIDGGPVSRALAGQTPAWLTAVDDTALTDVDQIEESDFLGAYRDVEGLFHRQAAVAASLNAPPVRLTFQTAAGDAFEVLAVPGHRPAGDLPALFWLQLLFGAGALLIGGWLWSLRPRDLAVAMFAVTGVGLMVSTGSSAVYSSRELALGGGLFRVLSATNHLGALIFGVGMAAVFALYPKRLVAGPRPLLIMAGATLLWWIADTAHLAVNPQVGSYLPVLVLTLAIFGLIGVQWLRNRADPVARAALRWLGLSVFVGISGYVLGNAMPVLLGQTPSLPQGLMLGSFLLIYVGLALGLGRYRLFQLDQWAYRTVFYTAGALAVLAADAALIFALQMERAAALGVALLLIGLIYLPLRDTIWRALTSRRRAAAVDLFGRVMESALAGPQAEREARWRDLMRQMFDPLNLEAAKADVAEPAIGEDGLALSIPATAAGPALTLRFARGGRSLFGAEDLAAARQAVRLMAQAEASRQAYERGAAEERRRIAQDLHDDVGARLLSGLHKPDLPQTRDALRDAIADIRMVVGGLAGDRRPLDEVIADLRHEAGERLAAAGVELDWPLPERTSAVDLDYVVQKALRSAVREMVSNTIRHAGATRMSVRVEQDGPAIRLVVADDGVGLTALAPGRQGFGLIGLADRFEALGGALSLPKVAKGLTVDLRLDLSARPPMTERP